MARPRKHLPLAIERDIRTLAQRGFGAAQIWRHLQYAYGAETTPPHLREAVQGLDYKTVLRRVQEAGPRDESTPWTLDMASPAEAAVVMPVLGVALATAGVLLAQDSPGLRAAASGFRLTIGAAKWIVKVAAAAPDLPPDVIYDVALAYRAAELAAQQPAHRSALIADPAALDAFLACRPWESEEAAARYERVLAQGAAPSLRWLGPEWWRALRAREQARHTSVPDTLDLLRQLGALHERLDAMQRQLAALTSPGLAAMQVEEGEQHAYRLGPDQPEEG